MDLDDVHRPPLSRALSLRSTYSSLTLIVDSAVAVAVVAAAAAAVALLLLLLQALLLLLRCSLTTHSAYVSSQGSLAGEAYRSRFAAIRRRYLGAGPN